MKTEDFKAVINLPKPKYPDAKTLYSRSDGKAVAIERIDVKRNYYSSEIEQDEITYFTPKGSRLSKVLGGWHEWGLTDTEPTQEQIDNYSYKEASSETLGNGTFSVKAPTWKLGDVVKTNIPDSESVEFEVKAIKIEVEGYGSPDERINIMYMGAGAGLSPHGYKEELLELSTTKTEDLKPLEHHLNDRSPEVYSIKNDSENPAYIVIDLNEKKVTCDNPSVEIDENVGHGNIKNYSMCRISTFNSPSDFIGEFKERLNDAFPNADGNTKELVAFTLKLLNEKRPSTFAYKSLHNKLHYKENDSDKGRDYHPRIDPMQFQNSIIDMTINWKSEAKIEFTVEPQVTHTVTLYPMNS